MLIFTRILRGCLRSPKPLAGKRQNVTEKIPLKTLPCFGGFLQAATPESPRTGGVGGGRGTMEKVPFSRTS